MSRSPSWAPRPSAATTAAQAAALALTAQPECPLGVLFSKFADSARTQIPAAGEGDQNSFSPYFPAKGRGYTTVNP